MQAYTNMSRGSVMPVLIGFRDEMIK